jgi:hypothetical protein
MKLSIMGRLCPIICALIALGAINASSASAASLLCFEIDPGQTGLYETQTCEKDVGLEGKFILAKLDKEVKSGLYCALTDIEKTGNYETLEKCVTESGNGTPKIGNWIRVKAPTNLLGSNCAPITGSGSSLQNLAQKTVWKPLWEESGFSIVIELLECLGTTTVTYEPTSSGKGLLEWGANTSKLEPEIAFNKLTLDEFVGTDVAPEGPVGTAGTQIARMDEAGGKAGTNNKVVAIPVAQSAVSVIVSLPVGCKALSAASAAVKNGALSKAWLTGAVNFLTLVSGVTVDGNTCDNNALLEAREAASGTSAGFKRYLNDLEPSLWDKCALTAVEAESTSCWGTKKPDEAGNGTGGELAKKVLTTPGTIGYADLADARAQGFATPGVVTEHTNASSETFLSFIALVPNKGVTSEGNAQNPEVTATGAENGASNCKGATYPTFPEVQPDEDWSKITQSNATAGTAGVYPICTLTYDVAWEHYNLVEWTEPSNGKTGEKYSQAQFATTFNYLRWVASEAQKGTTAKEKLSNGHFSVLPSGVISKDEAGVVMKNIFFKEEGS